MADNEIATKAPESDAQETPAQHVPPPAAPGQSIIPGDSIAQEGPTMGVGSRHDSKHSVTDSCRNTAQQIDPRPRARHPAAN